MDARYLGLIGKVNWLVEEVTKLLRRVGYLENTQSGGGGGAPSGPAGGSLTGTYPNPTIASIPSGATGTTQSPGDNSTKIATTAYVDTAASTLTIGNAVTGGGAQRILFEDASQNLAASSDFTWTPSTDKLLVGSNNGLIFVAASSKNWTYPNTTGNVVIDAHTNVFTALQTVRLDNLGATTAVGLTIQNTTAASVTGHSNVYQSSPALTFLGSIQNALGAVNGYRLYYDAASGVSILRLGYATDGSTFTSILTIAADGSIASSGNLSGTATGGNTVSATTTVSAGTTITAGTGMTATTGNITATSGNIVLTAAGTTLDLNTSSAGNPTAGTATLSSGTVTVGSTSIAASDIIFVTLNTPGGTLGTHYSVPAASITPGGGFVINAVNTAGAVVTTDTSTVNWWRVKTH